jgi:hypothetical protein
MKERLRELLTNDKMHFGSFTSPQTGSNRGKAGAE